MPPTTPSQETSSHAGPSQAPASPRILIVDDEPVNLLVLQGVLKAEGYQVMAATNGPAGRLLAVTHLPDVILLDIMMPEESGFETCAWLKAEAATRDIPLIFISALTDVENKVRGLELGAVDYISKPFEKAEVLARVRLHLKLAAVNQTLKAEQAAKLKQLTDAQRAMLARPEDAPQARFAVCYLPALEAGGDFYDVLPIDAATCGYFVADICGHDLGSSIVTSSLKTLLHQNSGPQFTPADTLRTMNAVLSTVVFGGRYLTAQNLHLDREGGRAVLVNAGHPAPVYLPVGGPPRLVHSSGDILGVFPSVHLEPTAWPVQPGDRVLLYTDGLLERFAPPRRTLAAGQAFLLESMARHAAEPLICCANAVLDDMRHGSGVVEDDVVLLLVEV